jgi:hypothetical protein
VKQYYFYDLSTGEFTGQMISSNLPDPTAFIEQNTHHTMGYIEFSGSIKNYKVNLNTNTVEAKADTTFSDVEIKRQLTMLREQYFITRDPSILTQMETLQNTLQTG